MLRRDHVEPANDDTEMTALDSGSLPDVAAPVGRAGVRPAPSSTSPDYNRVGSGRFLRASLALFLAGFSTFSLLYCPQPLLPTLARVFSIDAPASSLSISFSTAALALSIVAAASLSDRLGRKSVMMVSLLAASGLNIVAAFAPSWPVFLLLRALEGVALGGVPAVAMTYLAEETDPGSLGLAMGIYVGATAVGGMGGRVITGLVAAVGLLARRRRDHWGRGAGRCRVFPDPAAGVAAFPAACDGCPEPAESVPGRRDRSCGFS